MGQAYSSLRGSSQSITTSAYLWTSVLRTPFWAIYNLLLFILYKDLHATPLQIGLFIALKPIVSLFSLYWSSFIRCRPDRLLSNVIWAGVLGHLPFLFFPFFYSATYVLVASAIYMMMLRGVVPAWMEIFKRNLPGGSKHKVFSYGSAFSYIGGAVLPIAIGSLLDGYFLSWRWIFPVTAILAILASFFQSRIPIKLEALPPPEKSVSFKEHLITPWTEAFKLLKERKDFRVFQIGFMFGGFGLMVMQPALPAFFIDSLGLSYTELSIALTLCKGVGFALTSTTWAKWMERMDLYRFSSYVTFLCTLFPFVLLAAGMNVAWVYVAYLLYGVMQAGSELSWHLSGPLFAKQEDSSVYSSVNIMTVGLRGLLAPQLGSFFILFFPAYGTLLVGGLFCFIATLWMARSRYRLHDNESLINYSTQSRESLKRNN